MDVPMWVWLATIGAIIALLVFDFFAHVRTPHAPSIKESAWWSVFYIAIAVAFGVGVTLIWGGGHGGEFFAGYVTEKSLSVDNLFVFVILMAKFAVPAEYQQKVLLVGIVLALVFRGLFIAVGAAVISNFSAIFYLFGLFLLYIAWKQATESNDEETELKDNFMLRGLQKVARTTPDYHGDKLTAIIDGKRYLTPMLVVMVAIGSTDILFALDSIPAIFGLTNEPYIVFTANAFALLGLRQLYFLIGGLLQRLVYLNIGLAIILGFIGVKLILEALHTNTLPFINGGHHVPVPEIPIWLSLLFILVVLTITVIASLIKSRKTAQNYRD